MRIPWSGSIEQIEVSATTTPDSWTDFLGGISASDLVERPRRRPDVACRRPDQAAGALLLEDVRRPACHTSATEHRRRQIGRNLGDVEHDRGPVLDVRLERTVGRLLAQDL